STRVSPAHREGILRTRRSLNAVTPDGTGAVTILDKRHLRHGPDVVRAATNRFATLGCKISHRAEVQLGDPYQSERLPDAPSGPLVSSHPGHRDQVVGTSQPSTDDPRNIRTATRPTQSGRRGGCDRRCCVVEVLVVVLAITTVELDVDVDVLVDAVLV